MPAKSSRRAPLPAEGLIRSAEEAGLRYVSDWKPGITRKRNGKAFSYVSADGTAVRDAETLARIRRLAIPPAWQKVWICPSAAGHIQATGYDARRRRQYRYHTRWREVRDQEKYGRMIAFAQALPRIRRRVDEKREVRDVGSQDVNEYLREISSEDFTAKDFRTWAGTVLAAKVLQEFKEFDSQAAAKRNVLRAIEHVAGRLGNTKAVCRKCYIHPAVIDAYLEKSLIETVREETERELREELKSLPPEEAAVLALLRKRMQRELREAEAPKRSGRAKRPWPGSRSKTAKSRAMCQAA